MTAFLDRGTPEFRRSIGELAPDTPAWCVSEPELLLGILQATGRITHLTDLFSRPDVRGGA